MPQSEVARLRQQIERECEASWRALHELNSGSAQHKAISRRLRRIDTCHKQLCALIGDEDATALVCEAFNRSGETFIPPITRYSPTQASRPPANL
ncbi:MAG TPA: hypothetical protein VFN35_29840 [Ktedonobacteraceae bacterium]|nr:hypothetical protein [Ktedonobacteraceae bacterium]